MLKNVNQSARKVISSLYESFVFGVGVIVCTIGVAAIFSEMNLLAVFLPIWDFVYDKGLDYISALSTGVTLGHFAYKIYSKKL